MNMNKLYKNPKFVKFVKLLDDYDWNGFVEDCGLMNEYDVEAKYIWQWYTDTYKGKDVEPSVWVVTLCIMEVFAQYLMMQPPLEECESCAKKLIKIMEE